MSSFVPVTPEQITIAVTVFSRRQYIKRAVSSALGQTTRVKVIVVEDCGPDETLQDYVKGEFGSRIEYYRNPKRRGLFGNWNACIERCQTTWLSILHDDDQLTPNFVESMIAMSKQIPGCGLYFGQSTLVDEHGNVQPPWHTLAEQCRRLTLPDVYHGTPFHFAGQLFRADLARSLGGFRETSQFAGDWEMWTQLLAYYGAAESRDEVAVTLSHSGADRGSNVVLRGGKLDALMNVQRKRIVALCKAAGGRIEMDRRRDYARGPVPLRALLEHGITMSRRLLAYNVHLLQLSKSPTVHHALFKALSKALGVWFVLLSSRIWNFSKRLLAR